MTLLRRFWHSIKRNPVINGFIAAMFAQLAHDYFANQIDWTNIVGYFSMLFIGVAVREFTVPAKENEEVKELVSKAIIRLEEEKQTEISAMLDRFEGRRDRSAD